MNLLLKVQSALATHIRAAGTSIPNIYKAFEHAADDLDNAASARIQLPCVICDTTDADETFPESGNFRVSCTVLVRSQIDDSTDAQHESRCAEIAALLMVSDLAASLTAAIPAFTCQYFYPGIRSTDELRDRHWESALTFDLDCCASDLSA
jgi:hypothetical protein